MAVIAALARYGGNEAEKTYPELLNRCQDQCKLGHEHLEIGRYNVFTCMHVYKHIEITKIMSLYLKFSNDKHNTLFNR